MSNLLGENFKPYVAKQIKTRQDILGRRESGVLSDSNSNEAIMWENGNSSYIALASSIDIKNSPIFISKVSSVISGTNINVGELQLDPEEQKLLANVSASVSNTQSSSGTSGTSGQGGITILYIPQLDLSKIKYIANEIYFSVNGGTRSDNRIKDVLKTITTQGQWQQVENYWAVEQAAPIDPRGRGLIKGGFLLTSEGATAKEAINKGGSATSLNPNSDISLDKFSPEKRYTFSTLRINPATGVEEFAYVINVFSQTELNAIAGVDTQGRTIGRSDARGNPIPAGLGYNTPDGQAAPLPTILTNDQSKAILTKVFTPELIDTGKETTDGTKRIQSLNIEGDPKNYLGNFVAKNMVLTNGTTLVNDDKSRTYKAGVANNNSTFNDFVYGFGGDKDFGLVAMPGLEGVDIKSKNMGSLREATITLRANSEKQFSLIDTLYCRIGYTMFLEWGNSVYFNNQSEFVSNPLEAGVPSLIHTFLNPIEGACFDTNTGLLSKINQNREISCGNYDAFMGRVTNFSWEFDPSGYYKVTLKLASIGDIIESLQIDQPLSNINLTDLLPPTTAQPSANSALESFLTVAATPIGNTSYDLNFFTKALGSGNTLEYNLNITKSKLVADTSYSEAGILTKSKLFNPETGGEYSEALQYDRAKTNSAGKVISARAIFGKEIYYYIRLGDILDFIKARLLIYNPACENRPIIDINTTPNENLCYITQYNISADPSKVMVRSELPPLDNLRGWAVEENKDRDRNWNYSLWQDSIFSKDFPSHKGGGTCKIEEFKLKNISNFNGKAVPYAGDIMNIYFEYNYLLGEVQGNRDKSSGTLNLLKFINSILDTANDCLGGINKLSTRIVDDNRLEIYDQNPLYGTQAPAPDTSIIRLFGIGNTLGGSFVKNFGITTELTSEFATQVTIGAQAQGSKDTTDALALSNWNYGLIDRIIPKKLSSSELYNDASKSVTTYQSIINLRNQLALLWAAYSEGVKKLDLERDTLTDQQVDDFQAFIETKSKTKEADRFFDTATDEQLQDTNVSEKKSYYFQHFPTKRYSEFVKLQKDFLALLHINSDFNSNQQGMLPINISLDIQGLSGIRIYDQLPIDTRFIPNYYPQTLYWIIKGVSHNISNNVWTTKLETIAVPKIPDLPTATSQTKSSKISEKSYESIPWDDILPISVENYSEGFDGANSGTNSNAKNEILAEEFKRNMVGYEDNVKLLWAPIENLDSVSVTSIPKPARSVGGSAPRNHYGIDIGARIGTKLYAAADGIFKYGNPDPNGYGDSWGYIEELERQPTGNYAEDLLNPVIRRHIYGHTNSLLVANGASVKKGDIIATVGNKGRSSGPHLHYEIWYPNRPKRQSPVAYLNSQTPTPDAKTFS